MSNPDVILIGASVRSLAESAIRDSMRPLCIDFFGDADLREAVDAVAGNSTPKPIVIGSFSDVPALLEGVDPTVPAMLSGGAENSPSLVQQISTLRPVAGCSALQIAGVRDPASVFPFLISSGCQVPKWKAVEDTSQLTDSKGQWIRKDARSSGGQLVSDWKPSVELHDHQYLQQRLEGICFSATFYSCDDDSKKSQVSVEGMSLQLSGLSQLNCSGYQYCGNVAGLTVSENLKSQLTRAAESITEHWQIKGFFGIDFMLVDRQPFVIEVNPRVTATHELYERLQCPNEPSHVARQLSAYSIAECCRPEPHEPRPNSVARLIIYADCPVEFSQASTTKLLRFTKRNAPLANVWLADVPPPNSKLPADSPVCSLYIALDHVGDGLELQRLLEFIPADTSRVTLSFLEELQAKIDIVQNV